MLNLAKKAAHFAIGIAAGAGAIDRPIIALTITAVFLGYQGLEAAKIHDDGYKETWQYGVGFGIGLAGRGAWSAYKWLKGLANEQVEYQS